MKSELTARRIWNSYKSTLDVKAYHIDLDPILLAKQSRMAHLDACGAKSRSEAFGARVKSYALQGASYGAFLNAPARWIGGTGRSTFKWRLGMGRMSDASLVGVLSRVTRAAIVLTGVLVGAAAAVPAGLIARRASQTFGRTVLQAVKLGDAAGQAVAFGGGIATLPSQVALALAGAAVGAAVGALAGIAPAGRAARQPKAEGCCVPGT